ncbi:MAG TPA: hypothetical protein VJB66_00590 [Candidatus Nanoarchaeia archaeon]|nr:hypothetical protein [Candidatus Nanoarchaeia archaeon]
MVNVTLLVAIINIIIGVAVIALPSFLRLLVGGYLILIGAISIIAYLL